MKKYSLKNKLMILILGTVLPFVCITIYLIFSLRNYSYAYDEIVSNMTIANSYNLNFKEEIDESLYKLVVGAVTFESISEDKTLEDPYQVIGELREDFGVLMRITTDKESKSWLQRLLRNIDTLEDRVNDIKINLDEGGHYDENIESLKIQMNDQVQKFIVLWTARLLYLIICVLFLSSVIANSITRPIRELCGVTGV